MSIGPDEETGEWDIYGKIQEILDFGVDSVTTEDTVTTRFDRGAPTNKHVATDIGERVFLVDRNNSRLFDWEAGLYSDDYGDTWSSTGGSIPNNGDPLRVIDGYIFGAESNPLKLYRSPIDDPPNGYTWTQVLQGQADTTAGLSGGRYRLLEQHPDTGSLIIGEYGTGSFNPKLYRSTDTGASWTEVHHATNHDHVHCVAPDPYESGHWVVALGDSETHRFLESTDDGQTWTLTGKFQMYDGQQSVGVDFNEDHIVFSEDKTPTWTGPWGYNRETGNTFRLNGEHVLKKFGVYLDSAIMYAMHHDRDNNIYYYDVRGRGNCDWDLVAASRGIGGDPILIDRVKKAPLLRKLDNYLFYRTKRIQAFGNGGVS